MIEKLKDTLTQLFHNPTHKMRKRKRRSKTRWFYKLSKTASLPWSFQHMEVWVARLSKLLSEKRAIPPSEAINWKRTKIWFALLKFCLLCLRGIRSFNRNIATVRDNVQWRSSFKNTLDRTMFLLYFQGGLYAEILIYIFVAIFNDKILRCIFEYCNKQSLFHFQCTNQHFL